MQKVCLYLEELAQVQHRPDAQQTELTDVVDTDIPLLRLPPARPYEYLFNAGVSVVMRRPDRPYSAILSRVWGMQAVFESVTLLIHYAQWRGLNL